MLIITGECIQKELETLGITATFCRFSLSPQLIKYYFKLKYHQQIKKALKLNEVLTSWSGQTMECTAEPGYFCITTPTNERHPISITKFKDIKKNNFDIIIGIDEDGTPQTETIDKLIHLLVAGTTGSGKSIVLNNIIMGLACYNKPQDLGVILIDPKQVEFNIYKNLPHLLAPPITNTEDAEKVLKELYEEMENRYYTLNKHGREKNTGEFKKIIVVIDELADLILQNKQIKEILIKLLQKSRAAGIHFVVATQSPRASVLTGLVLANLPSRLALTCASARESTLILGHKGAEKLTGNGDGIFKTPQSTKEKRIQAPYITKKQIKKLLNN